MNSISANSSHLRAKHPIKSAGFLLLTAQLAMVGKKAPATLSDLDLPDPLGLNLPRTLRWAYLALVSEEK